MKSFWLSVIVACSGLSFAFAADAPKAPVTEATKQLQENPDDAKVFSAWMNETFKAISETMDSAPDDAKQLLAEVRKVLAGLRPVTAAGKAQVSRGKLTVASFEETLELLKVSVEELQKAVEDKPDDTVVLRKFVRKVVLDVGSIARVEPGEAETRLKPAKEFLTKLRDEAKEKTFRTAIDTQLKTLSSLEESIAHGRQLLSLVGKPAPKLDVAEWANGSPLTGSDLNGKVVLLDFWAVWCGPCIATFPHLREWQTKYSEKGLVIVGVTRYYNYVWDESANKAVRGKEKNEVSPEDERAMLTRFAEQHQLKHRFAIQTEEHAVADDYFVKGIPQAVVIDRQGIVRLVRVGSGSKNTKALGDMIEQLVNEMPVTAK